MPFLNDEVKDQGLDYATANGTRLYLCSAEPTTYTEATSTYALGNATVTTSATSDGTTDGRKVEVSAILNGTTTASGSATHWALTDASSILVAADSLNASKSVTSGNLFSMEAFTLTIRDPS